MAAPESINGLVRLANGKQLHVSAAGSSEAPAALFLHGLGSSLNFYGAVCDALKASNIRCISYDFDGAGLSPLHQPDLSIESLADDAVHLMDALHIKQAALVGHSMSGLVASTVAAKHPERVTKLVLLGAITPLPPAGQEMMRGRAKKARDSGMFELADAVPTAAFSKRSKAERRLAYAFVRTLVGTTKPEAYAAACIAIAEAKKPDYSAIRAPTLVIRGVEDPLSTETTDATYRSEISKCRFVTLNDVSHWPAVEDPEQTAEALKAFLLDNSS